jgi:hypothetical protein
MSTRVRPALLGTALAPAALAAGSPGAGAITATLFTTGTPEDPVNVNNDRIRLKTRTRPRCTYRRPGSRPATWSTGTTIQASR